MKNEHYWGLVDYCESEARLIVSSPPFDVDSFPLLGETLINLLSAEVKEKQFDADLHSWLIDFEGSLLFLRAEHYSESLWLEALDKNQSQQVMAYLAKLFAKGF